MLVDLLDYNLDQRTTFCVTFFKRPPLAAIWSVSSLEPSARWTAAATISSLLAERGGFRC
jgi:hypothetical protein